MAQQRIAQKSLGSVNVMNTEHGRIASVEREQFGDQRPQWRVSIACNGIAEYSKVFRSRVEALCAYEALS